MISLSNPSSSSGTLREIKSRLMETSHIFNIQVRNLATPPVTVISILCFSLKIFNHFLQKKKTKGCFSRLPFEIYVEFKPLSTFGAR